MKTNERLLKELDYAFAIPTRKYADFRLGLFLPYQVKRPVLLRRDVKLEPLYKFNAIELTTVSGKGLGIRLDLEYI